jgi:hypothetical protein
MDGERHIVELVSRVREAAMSEDEEKTEEEDAGDEAAG